MFQISKMWFEYFLDSGVKISNGMETRSCLGRVFNFKLDSFVSKQFKCTAYAQPPLELKTRPGFVLYAEFCPWLDQGILTEGEGSVQLTTSLG